MNKQIMILFIIIISSCSYKNNLKNSNYALNVNKGTKSNSIIYFDSASHFKYIYSHKGHDFYSKGNYNIKRNYVYITSEYIDSIIPMEVIEIFDSSLREMQIVIDSNFVENFDFFKVVLNDSIEISTGNYVNGNLPIIKYNSNLTSISFIFINGFKTRKYEIMANSSNNFKIYFSFPGVLDSFRLINNQKLKLKKKRLIWNGSTFFKVN